MHVSALGVIVGSGAAEAWLCIVASLLPRAQYGPNRLLLSPVTLPLGVAAMLTVTPAIVVSAQLRDATAIAAERTATVQRTGQVPAYVYLLSPVPTSLASGAPSGGALFLSLSLLPFRGPRDPSGSGSTGQDRCVNVCACFLYWLPQQV